MDKHTFIGKRKVGSTDISDFTDYQGLGRDPLYRRYQSVNSLVKRVIDHKYVHFLAVPNYSETEDIINWYIDEWNDTPIRLVDLSGDNYCRYKEISDLTIAHYKAKLAELNGEDLQVMACLLRYIDEDFIYCTDGKVYLLAWGMTPDTRKHISKGELVHDAPNLTKYKISFDAGEHGKFQSRIGSTIMLPEGCDITKNDLPVITVDDGFEFVGWQPAPLGVKVNKDMIFTATYKQTNTHTEPPLVVPIVSPTPQMATCTFNAGSNGYVYGNSTIQKTVGSSISLTEIPNVKANKGYKFKGWDKNPVNMLVKGNITFNAIYEQTVPWYKKIWMWLAGSGCLKWLLWALLIILLLLLLSWLLRGCHSCSRDVNGVVELPKVVSGNGDTIDDNGYVHPIETNEGLLPNNGGIVAPIREEDGSLPPIDRQPGVPPVIANRLFLFIEDETSSVDELASAFKLAYPGDQYIIIGYDRDVKSILIQIPENEKEQIRKTINQRIPDIPFLVFDEEVYELNGHLSKTSSATPGWHLEAVHAPQAWNITKGSNDVKVAIIDDGIQADHPMFKGRIVDAYNVYTQDNKLSVGDGHGTHTAGLAVGSLEYKDKGAAGIAPYCQLMPIQVIDNKMCPLSALVSGVMYAVHKDADVVNISIAPSFQGLNQLPVEVQNEIANTQFKNVEKLWERVCNLAASKNTILVFAAGNDDILSSIPPENRTSVAITVGAVDQNKYPTDFTNYGLCTDVSAPGKEIYSSFPQGQFRNCDGTSMAAPIVTGAVALMKSIKKDLTVEQANNVLYNTGADVYGNMPPMVLVDKALEAVIRGDFSERQKRPIRPVPDSADIDGDAPSSWSNDQPVETIVAPNDENSAAPIKDNENDYDAIRRLIAIYKQKIIELEQQLPENKK